MGDNCGAAVQDAVAVGGKAKLFTMVNSQPINNAAATFSVAPILTLGAQEPLRNWEQLFSFSGAAGG